VSRRSKVHVSPVETATAFDPAESETANSSNGFVGGKAIEEHPAAQHIVYAESRAVPSGRSHAPNFDALPYKDVIEILCISLPCGLFTLLLCPRLLSLSPFDFLQQTLGVTVFASESLGDSFGVTTCRGHVFTVELDLGGLYENAGIPSFGPLHSLIDFSLECLGCFCLCRVAWNPSEVFFGSSKITAGTTFFVVVFCHLRPRFGEMLCGGHRFESVCRRF